MSNECINDAAFWYIVLLTDDGEIFSETHPPSLVPIVLKARHISTV